RVVGWDGRRIALAADMASVHAAMAAGDSADRPTRPVHTATVGWSRLRLGHRTRHRCKPQWRPKRRRPPYQRTLRLLARRLAAEAGDLADRPGGGLLALVEPVAQVDAALAGGRCGLRLRGLLGFLQHQAAEGGLRHAGVGDEMRLVWTRQHLAEYVLDGGQLVHLVGAHQGDGL